MNQIEEKGYEAIPGTKIDSYKDDKGCWSYSLEKNGRVKFADSSWMVIAMHSVHWKGAAGDIAIVHTSKGEWYYNLGHYCGSLGLVGSEVKLTGGDDFLATSGKTGKAGEMIQTKWLPLPQP